MSSVINTNVMSLNAQRQLNKSQAVSSQAMERLSSGLRINSAKDDAAGLAISTGMQSQIKGINQGVRNANDGISMAQTAEGSMDEMTNILQRMRELSVQASNDTNSSSNRASIQKEVDQLYSELDRIAETTQFNGTKLLDGSTKSTTLQIGANSGETLSFSIDAVTTKDLNLNSVSSLGELNGGRVSGESTNDGDMAINGVDIDASGTTAKSAAAAINKETGLTGVTAAAYNTVEGTGNISGVTTGDLTIDGGNGPVTIEATSSAQDLVDTINRDVGGVTASLNKDGGLVLSNDTGEDIVIGSAGAGNGDAAAIGLTEDTFKGSVSLTSSDGSEIEISQGSSATASSSSVQDFGFNEGVGSASVTGAQIDNSLGAIKASDEIQINGVDLGDVAGTSAADKAFAINAISDQTGVSASAKTEVSYSADIETLSSGDLAINGANVDVSEATSLDDVVGAINSAGLQGVVASTNQDTGELVLTSKSGADINVQASTAGLGAAADTSVEGNEAGQTTGGQITLTGEGGKDVVITSNATAESGKQAALDKLGMTDQGGSSAAVGTGLSVSTSTNAQNSIDRIDDALDKIGDSRANLGAIQNRLGSTISNLENVSQNTSAANSRIQDADFAAETSKMSKAKILQQAGTSMLAQANASSQSVLSLLG
jgi:flagellin